MILKIKAAEKSDGWFIYDNAEEVFFSRHPNIRGYFEDSFGEDAEKNVLAYSDGLNAVKGSFFHPIPDGAIGLCDDTPAKPEGWFISFRCGEGTFELWGDTEVYLLNDNGRNIERIF